VGGASRWGRMSSGCMSCWMTNSPTWHGPFKIASGGGGGVLWMCLYFSPCSDGWPFKLMAPPTEGG